MAEEVRQPISPQVRRRLQQQFQHGSKMIAAGNFDYAIDMFSRCVLGDPGNVVYVQNLLSALQRKYSNTKKGSKLSLLQGMGGKTAMMNAHRKKDWLGVFTAGVELLQKNPFDSNTLTSLADACEHLECEESQVEFLKAAVQTNLKDAELNRLLARALESSGDFDGAIICWNRVRAADSSDEEAKKGIGNCTIKRTIKTAKYEEAETSTEVMADKQAQAERMGQAGLQLTPEQQLEKAIAKKPDELDNYVELAELHTRNDRHPQAVEVLTKALQIAPGDLNLRERMEEAQLRCLRDKVSIAENRAQQERTEEAIKLFKRYKDELNSMEMEVYRNRCERYPTHLGYRYELGLRLKKAKMINEAIRTLQEARSDPQRKGDVLLALGECFHQIKQYSLAISNYEQAIKEISERNLDNKKLALYRAGKLALGLRDLDKAEAHLTALAGLDFTYQDVPDLLDKIRKLRENGDTGSGTKL
jgi:tetratricopeptide (TPR) repeat protein